MRRWPILLLAAAGLLLAGGCAVRPSEQASPGELMLLGQEDLRAERFEAARQAFQRLLREYPDSNHRRAALLNLADSYYKGEEYIEARVQYAEYVQLYPVSQETARAYYFLGMSDFNRMLEPDQEQAVTRDALKSFHELIRRFPRSEFAAQAKEKVQTLRERLARHHLAIARFYLTKGARVSAIPRFQEVVKEYADQPGLRAEAMFHLAESYRMEESYQKAGSTYRDLIKDYPDNPLSQRAYRRLLELTGAR
ncbi:MAG: outer membrane protein assembly factor BamD [Nitrospinota bacterium]|mgnify:CR=1 FL=1